MPVVEMEAECNEEAVTGGGQGQIVVPSGAFSIQALPSRRSTPALTPSSGTAVGKAERHGRSEGKPAILASTTRTPLAAGAARVERRTSASAPRSPASSARRLVAAARSPPSVAVGAASAATSLSVIGTGASLNAASASPLPPAPAGLRPPAAVGPDSPRRHELTGELRHRFDSELKNTLRLSGAVGALSQAVNLLHSTNSRLEQQVRAWKTRRKRVSLCCVSMYLVKPRARAEALPMMTPARSLAGYRFNTARSARARRSRGPVSRCRCSSHRPSRGLFGTISRGGSSAGRQRVAEQRCTAKLR